MKNLLVAHALAHAIVLIVATSVASDAFADDPVYLGANGVVAIEAESATAIPPQWRLETSVAGFKGDGYLRALTNSFGTPGVGVISYEFKVDRTSDYQFAFRSRIGQGTSGTEHNDTWVRVVNQTVTGPLPIPNDNDTRTGGWHKIYMNVNGSWSHNASNKDNDPHSLSWTLNDDEIYTLQISSRSAGHLVDRLFLWDRDRYNLASESGGFSANNAAFDHLPNSAVLPEPTGASLVGVATLGFASRRRKR